MGCGCGGGGSKPVVYKPVIDTKNMFAARLNHQIHDALKSRTTVSQAARSLEIRKLCPKCSYPMNKFRRTDVKTQRVTNMMVCLNNKCRYQQEEV